MSKITIVMYHFVRDLMYSRYPEIKGLDVSLFKEQLMYFMKYYDIVKMEDIIDALNNKKDTKRVTGKYKKQYYEQTFS